MSFEYGRPKNSSKPWRTGKERSHGPDATCHRSPCIVALLQHFGNRRFIRTDAMPGRVVSPPRDATGSDSPRSGAPCGGRTDRLRHVNCVNGCLRPPSGRDSVSRSRGDAGGIETADVAYPIIRIDDNEVGETRAGGMAGTGVSAAPAANPSPIRQRRAPRAGGSSSFSLPKGVCRSCAPSRIRR